MALRLVLSYKDAGVDSSRVLIKIASTWEGIEAGRILETQYGIHCNLTLLFSLTQAAACAESGITLISPFVGRILDWHKRANGCEYSASSDPGVLSVRMIYNYLKQHSFSTSVMGASFRNIGEIEELAGLDFLTISPKLLEELASIKRPLARKLSPKEAIGQVIPRISVCKETFQAAMAEDRAASELLKDGIKKFEEDSEKLLRLLSAQM